MLTLRHFVEQGDAEVEGSAFIGVTSVSLRWPSDLHIGSVCCMIVTGFSAGYWILLGRWRHFVVLLTGIG